ncbi:MAG: conjugal transfer protein TraX, partial [Lachnospiraceae bacterium]|nr:conjugal transfer protein TraX [Lachnospiraceae bacterium]
MDRSIQKRFGISAAVLKWIAVVTMLTDHFAVAVYRWIAVYNNYVYFVLRKIGRIAFPIYCFLLVEGFYHTRSVSKYLRNCFLFAVVSEIPFNMAIFGKVIYPKGQNVYFTLCISLCALIILNKFKARYEIKYMLLKLMVIVLAAYAGEVLEVDYHWKGVLFIIMFYYVRDMQEWIRNLAGICAFAYEIT